nr:unnamed protein product [Callosobruchus chinensis]
MKDFISKNVNDEGAKLATDIICYLVSSVRHAMELKQRIRFWGNKSSILVGDLLLTLAFRWLIECGNLNILSILSRASHLLVKGEIKQMTTRFDPHKVRENYFDIIGEKTASLFSACCEAASTVSGATNDKTERLKNLVLILVWHFK